MNCKRCNKELTGKQESYCSAYCSRLYLKSLYRKRNRKKILKYNQEWRKNNTEKLIIQKKKYAQKKRLEFLQLLKREGMDDCLTKTLNNTKKQKLTKWKIVRIMECENCGEKHESKNRNKKYCGKCRRGDKSKRFAVLLRDNFTCGYCGRKAPNVILQVDHIIPKSKGGTNKKNNLITACRDCNIGKFDVLLEDIN